VTERVLTSSSAGAPTAKSQGFYGWALIGLAIVVLIVTILFAVVGGHWWALAIGATSTYTFYTGINALRRAKQLSE
jgi:hypothetical protein